jgi:hypothetical protein
MGVPASLMQALQGGQGGSSGGPPSGASLSGPSGGPPPSIQIGGGPQDSDSGSGGEKPDGDWEQDLHDALDALRELAADATDHTETNIIDKCIAALSGLTSKRQAGAESALGVTPAHKAMSRAY